MVFMMLYSTKILPKHVGNAALHVKCRLLADSAMTIQQRIQKGENEMGYLDPKDFLLSTGQKGVLNYIYKSLILSELFR